MFEDGEETVERELGAEHGGLAEVEGVEGGGGGLLVV
jgi:hypothetical protein